MASNTAAGRCRRVAAFYVPTFLITHSVTALYLAAGGSWRRLDSFVFANIAMTVPALVSLAVVRFAFREPLRPILGLRWRWNRWLLLAWLLPVATCLLALGLGLLVPGTSFSPGLAGLGERFVVTPEQWQQALRPAGPLHPPWTLLVQGLLLGPTLSAIGGLGEELGWRGLLHHELAPLGFWRESQIVGLLWGVWHLPLVFEGYGYPHHPWLGALLLLAFTQTVAPIYTLVRVRSGSVFAAAVLHGSFGATSLLALAPIQGGGELWVGLTGLAGLAAAIAAVFALGVTGAFRRFRHPDLEDMTS